MRFIGVAEFAINLIGNKEEVVAFAEVTYGKHILLREEFSRRVARIADKHGLGLVAYELLEFGDIRDAE